MISPSDGPHMKILKIIYFADGGRITYEGLEEEAVKNGIPKKSVYPIALECIRRRYIGIDSILSKIEDPRNLRLVATAEKCVELSYKLADYSALIEDAAAEAEATRKLDKINEVIELMDGDQEFKEDFKTLDEQPPLYIYLTAEGAGVLYKNA